MMNKAQVNALVTTDQAALEIIITGLYLRQTKAEQRQATTTEDNDRGFSKRTDRQGTRLAKWLVTWDGQPTGRHLTGYHITKAQEIATHHWRQAEGVMLEHAARKFPGAKLMTFRFSVWKSMGSMTPATYQVQTEEGLRSYLLTLDPFQRN